MTTETDRTTAGAQCTRTSPEALERLARVAKALSDPIRLGMLDVMTQGRGCCGLIDPRERGVPGSGDPEGICVCEFQAQFGLAQSKASYHLRVLREAGLVTEEIRGKWSFYTVDGGRIAQAMRDLASVVNADGVC
jgi:ArsR family transcriptional regulator, arsenate/arsenite/antimonite-responsive transcriptional repressor